MDDIGPGHRPRTSSLGDLTLLELEHTPMKHKRQESITVIEVQPDPDDKKSTVLPSSTLVIVAETEKLEDKNEEAFLSGISDMKFPLFPAKFKWKDWDCNSWYSDYIKAGLTYNNKYEEDTKYIMLFESPSSSTSESSFHNKSKYQFHDWPPPKSTKSKKTLGPCRYSLMNGPAFPAFLATGVPPTGLLEHWKEVLPSVPSPHFVDKVHENDVVYAYLPVEQIKNHVNDPDTHYHLAGKDAIHLMTQKTTSLLPDTRTLRPCVVKTTHSMGSKGIFIIRNDEDEKEFEEFLEKSGNPTFVVTDFVDIKRNIACHFFMHPSGEITWFGSNENLRLPNGQFSSDSYLIMADQAEMKHLQAPFVEEVVQYCKTLGFWGFCGIDVLFDSKDRGYLVDINPRVTGSCPALMTLHILAKHYGFTHGLFRRSGDINYFGPPEKLFEEVAAYNTENEGKSRIVVHSYFLNEKGITRVNIGVYGKDIDECKTVLNRFAKPAPSAEES